MSEMTNEICAKYVGLHYEDLPHQVVDTTKKFILDTLGCGLAGTTAPGSGEIRALFASFGGKEEATVLGFGNRIPCSDAAFVNSVLSHALDFDDTLDAAAMHCYVTALPAALSLAEAGNASGRQLIAAVTLGVDLSCRLGVAIETPLSWIRTATCGSFGSTIAAAKILELNQQSMHDALGIVYSQTAGNAQCLLDGGLAKRMQPGFSARAGVLSALMAGKGITGAREVFEGKFGFFNLYERGVYARERCLDGLGEDFLGMRLSIKPYPACRMTHSAIDAALAVKEKYRFRFEDVDRVELFVSKMAKEMVGGLFEVRQNPQVDAQFSIAYTVGVALAKGKPFIEDFDERVVRDEQRKSAADKVSVLADSGIGDRDLKPATIKVYLKNGGVLTHRIDVLKGHPDNPLSWEECIEKFKKCTALGVGPYGDETIARLVETILNLEEVKDVGNVLAPLLGK